MLVASKHRLVERLDDKVFAELEKALDLDAPSEKLRKRLNLSVSLYLWDHQRIKPGRAAVRARLNALRKAALHLYEQLNENPTEVAARTTIKLASDKLLQDKTYVVQGKTYVGSEYFDAVAEEVEKLPDCQYKTYCRNLHKGLEIDDVPNEREVLWEVNRLVQRGADIDLIALEELRQLCRFIETLKQDKGGRTGSLAWNELMLDLAKAYEEATGKKATVTESEHRAPTGERYSGQFVRAATIYRETAALCFGNVRPRLNGALGPALRRLVEPRTLSEGAKLISPT